MTASISSRLRGLLTLAGVGLVGALATGHPELVVLTAPVLVLVVAGLALRTAPSVDADVEVELLRLIEGEAVAATVRVRNGGARALELELGVLRTPRIAVQPDGPILVRLAGGQETRLALELRPQRWGSHSVGPLLVRARDSVGIVDWRGRLAEPTVLKVFPNEQQLRHLVAPLRTQPFLGAHVARARGQGIEFADIRPFMPGDRLRQVNWRATARGRGIWVTERHPEHASDVVLLIDTFAEARDATSGTLDDAVRAAASLARGHLARRDRVALVDFGGTLHWLEPAFGTIQLYRIVDALLSSDIAFSYAWRDVESIPRKLLPTDALVIAVTPLLDERSLRLITDLRTRGRDVAILEVSPVRHTPPGVTPADTAAYRLWTLERAALRMRLQALGIGVALWEPDASLEAGIEGVNAFRRSAARVVSA